MTVMLLVVIFFMSVLSVVAAMGCLRLRKQLEIERKNARAVLVEREAFTHERAVNGERERIYNDLHDDLGASILHLIYTAPTLQHADGLRAVMQDLRDVVTRSRGTPGTLSDVLGDIQNEAEQRLQAVDIELAWTAAESLPDPVLDNETSLHLHRIVREAISNVIRHAQAKHVRIRVVANKSRLAIELTDDGSGAIGDGSNGSGMRTMRHRADEIAASIDWRAGTQGGTKILLTVPLPREAA